MTKKVERGAGNPDEYPLAGVLEMRKEKWVIVQMHFSFAK